MRGRVTNVRLFIKEKYLFVCGPSFYQLTHTIRAEFFTKRRRERMRNELVAMGGMNHRPCDYETSKVRLILNSNQSLATLAKNRVSIKNRKRVEILGACHDFGTHADFIPSLRYAADIFSFSTSFKLTCFFACHRS